MLNFTEPITEPQAEDLFWNALDMTDEDKEETNVRTKNIDAHIHTDWKSACVGNVRGLIFCAEFDGKNGPAKAIFVVQRHYLKQKVDRRYLN